jgi:hypothetical protein
MNFADAVSTVWPSLRSQRRNVAASSRLSIDADSVSSNSRLLRRSLLKG